MTFSPTDIEQINNHGVAEVKVNEQLQQFRKGFPYIKLVSAATPDSGIVRMSEEDQDHFSLQYDDSLSMLNVLKFVPASGAATRMFQPLFKFLETGDQTSDIKDFKNNIKKFAFYNELSSIAKSDDVKILIHTLLYDMLYSEWPKAMIKFHHYEDNARTALEEHLVEGALYTNNGDTVSLHFTVSEKHITLIEGFFAEVCPYYEDKFNITYNLSLSIQKPSTDTLAVNPDNTPFRTTQGSLLFRPAGHGALLVNLNALDADMVFIKNIDNVQPDRVKPMVVRIKKSLAGFLLSVKNEVAELSKKINTDTPDFEDIERRMKDKLQISIPDAYHSIAQSEKIISIQRLLDRPIRVCGMVKNQGEPGGGPYWVEDDSGIKSLQIVEKSQVNTANESQLAIFNNATHFNPVDLVCWLNDINGKPFDLMKYSNPTTGFITEKSQNGRQLKAMELPGLWNGAMADWITIFVEVPVETFSPVKTVFDLLRPQHQTA